MKWSGWIKFAAGWAYCVFARKTLDNFDFHFAEPQDAGLHGGLFARALALARKKLHAAASQYLVSRYYRLGEKERRAFIASRVWGGEAGFEWHQKAEQFYLTQDEPLGSQEGLIEGILAVADGEYDGIVEIGSGNGWFLHLLAQRLKNKGLSYVGLDLNGKTVEMARARYSAEPELEFRCATIDQFSREYSLEKKMVVVNTVLEYFSVAEIEELCSLLKRKKAAYLAVQERALALRAEVPINGMAGQFSYYHEYEKVFLAQGLCEVFHKEADMRGHAGVVLLSSIWKTGRAL